MDDTEREGAPDALDQAISVLRRPDRAGISPAPAAEPDTGPAIVITFPAGNGGEPFVTAEGVMSGQLYTAAWLLGQMAQEHRARAVALAAARAGATSPRGGLVVPGRH